MEKEAILNNVSRETIKKLEAYQNMVLEWNKNINLISKASEQDIWNRHIIDSLQLYPLIDKKDRRLYDFGSGAGFPAVVLAIVGEDLFPDLAITLVESIGKKTLFLESVKKTLNLNIDIQRDRIENIRLPKPDVITSRALASLDKLLDYAEPFCNKNTKLIFPKGEKWQDEIKHAQKKWVFECVNIKSITEEKGCILLIKNIRRTKNG